MTWKLHQQKLKGRKVLTNYETVFSDDLIRSSVLKTMPADLVNCDVGASEVHTFMESRRSQRSDQMSIGYAISQFRKRRVNFHWDSQDVGKVDLRLARQETDIIIHCSNLGCGDIDCRDQSCGIKTCGIFYYEPYQNRTGRRIGDFYLNGPKDFYGLFDSEEIVMDLSGDQPENE